MSTLRNKSIFENIAKSPQNTNSSKTGNQLLQMMIPRDTLNELNELSILSVASKLDIYTKRKLALCFMHDDSHPSLHFNTEKNTWKCYVCNKGGGVINLVMEKLGIGFIDACKWLADQFNVIIPEDDGFRKRIIKKTTEAPTHQNKKTRTISDTELYEWVIQRAGLSDIAKHFLFEERKYSEKVVKSLGIGSVTYPKMLVNSLVNHFGEDRCIKSGLIKRGQYGFYLCFFTPCLLFPYKNMDGLVTTLQSRYLGKDEKAHRYQFIRDAQIGLYNIGILKEMEVGEKLYLSEGVTDCVGLLSSGRKAIAIPSATLLKEDLLNLLAGRNLYMYPDQDEAGERLFNEIQDKLGKRGTMVVRVSLPKGCKDFSDYYLKTQQ